ncbi:THUMP-like domain-containing protein [Flavobacterium sp.]
MNKFILSDEIQAFIDDNILINVSKLALQKPKFPNVDWTLLLNQIESKQKAATKLPTWYSSKNIYYPSKLSVEQTSSEKTAKYKADLVSGTSLIDLTGGFGVDDFYFSKKIKHVTHCEIDLELSSIVQHNCQSMSISNIKYFAEDSQTVLKKLDQKFNWIYIDPSRRNDAKGKVFMLKDCLPNVPNLLDFYFEYSDNIMVKTAPILDITAALTELKNVKQIHIVAVDNEVKELLWILEKGYDSKIEIIACNILKENQEFFSFMFNEFSSTTAYHLPKKYLYEPNAAIMKSGGFNEIGHQFNLEKLHQNSHLFTSNTVIDFPGRVFEIETILTYDKVSLKNHLSNKKANVTTRNFPESVENIRKKWKINDGGKLYCFFTTDLNNTKIVLLCKKLK